MLNIIRTQPTGTAITTFLDASISLRKESLNVEGYPDIIFSMKTYEKIAREGEAQVGDLILLPINLFFDTLNHNEHVTLYEMYLFAKQTIAKLDTENVREIQDLLQEKIFNAVHGLHLDEKMVEFCNTHRFVYPDLSEVGTLPHHSPAKTFVLKDYIEITAISLLSKMMVPIWGEFIRELGNIGISNNQREKIAFDLIEPTLEEGAFERIYGKLSFTLTTLVKEKRSLTDKKAALSATTSSFIITHNGIDDEMFDKIVMATMIVKRLATYECFIRLKDGNVPNAMVYIYDGITRTAETRIQSMRNTMNTMPRRELAQHDTEDNSSILDHASKTSKKPIDVPIFVTTAVENWDIPKLLIETETPMDVFESAVEYYETNSFDVSPLCQALVASFIGTRFGGSKCIGYLTPKLHQKIVILLQIFLIKNDMVDLATLASSKTSAIPIDGAANPIALRIQSNLKSSEYLQCQSLLKGFIEKPVSHFVKRTTSRKVEVDRIDFVNHISRMIEWLVRYNHTENMAPALWNYSKQENRPIVGSEIKFDENIIRNLCKFYLIFHGGQRPF